MDGDTLDANIRPIVERAYGSVRKGHDRVSNLKHSLEARSSN
jgi:hypothetical protein